ncbi:MAG: response regulator [Planctomycetota bacterium]
MTGLRRNLGLVIALAALAAPSFSFTSQDDLKSTFAQAVELYRRGRNDEALAALQKAAAMEPSQEAAYELWKETDYRDWRDLLTEGGQFEIATKRLIDLARLGRKAIANDEAAIQALVVKVVADGEAMERRTALNRLSADHGEYAVPYLLPYLSSENTDEDRRVLAMHALSQLDSDVVNPLVEALASEDRILRRNVVMVLGNMADRRTAGYLLAAASSDKDESVRAAARESATRTGASGDAVGAFLALGDAFHHARGEVLGPRGTGEVVWSFADNKLTPEPVPQNLFNEEMALRAYSRALATDPSSVAALAGLARSWMAERTEIEAMEAAGQDVSAWKARSDAAAALVNSAGVQALDTAMTWSVRTNDSASGAGLARALGDLASSSVPSLEAAMQSGDGAMRAEAAVALGKIAARSSTPASAEVVQALSEAAGREIQRLAAVIGSGDGAAQIAGFLRENRVFVSHWDTGAKGSTMVRRSPGLDLIVMTETLPDLTTAQVLEEIKADERTQGVPVVLIVKDAAAAAEMYGDRIAGTTTGSSDTAAITATLQGELEGDRALAAGLAKRAAEALAHLAHGGKTDISGALESLTAASARADDVAIPALHALGLAGGAGQAATLVAALADEARSEAVRTAAGDAIAAMLGRDSSALDEGALMQVATVASSAAPAPVREAASRALGRARMEPAARAEVLKKLRG